MDVIKSKKSITFQRFKIYSRAFGVAIFLWIFVVSNNEYEILFEFPIEARNLNSQKAHKEEIPPFVTARIRGIGRDLFRALIIKKYSNLAGFDSNKYAGHSLRSGFATSAAEAGAEERSIMNMTGHKSTEMVRRYIKEANLFKNNALNKIKF